MRKASTFSFYAIASLFFLWALAHNLNPILIPHLKKACQLSDFQSALVDSAFYIAYFVMALPAGRLITRFGYKKTMITGLFLFSAGASLFIPAASTLNFVFFLGALFVVGSGLALLETSANPYVAVLGPESGAARRLNFAQSFNGLGATLAAYGGSLFILSGKTLPENLNPEQIQFWLTEDAATVKMPYMFISLTVLVVMIIFALLPLPEIEDDKEKSGLNFKKLLSYKSLQLALPAQFFYVGAQVGIGSFFIRFTMQTGVATDKEAAVLLSIGLLLFMLGRFAGSFLMRWVNPNLLLFLYSLIAMSLTAGAILGYDANRFYGLIVCQFFMSIMFPTIFTNGLQGMGDDKAYGSSLLVMTIAGGAFIPPLMGMVSDAFGVAAAYWIPVICFAIIALCTIPFLKNDPR